MNTTTYKIWNNIFKLIWGIIIILTVHRVTELKEKVKILEDKIIKIEQIK